jgi:hypothetical protein
VKVPGLLAGDRRAAALEVLSCYYGLGRHGAHRPFTGSWFDTWDSTGTRHLDADRFAADDLVAVSFLSVEVPPAAALELLDTRAGEFACLLEQLGPDRDLVTQTRRWDDDWVGWTLWAELMKLPGVGATIASKLYARKRPRLRPIYDSVVARVIGAESVWEPLRAHLHEHPGFHEHLVSLRDEAGLSSDVSALRVFDVVAWMEGKGNVVCRWC